MRGGLAGAVLVLLTGCASAPKSPALEMPETAQTNIPWALVERKAQESTLIGLEAADVGTLFGRPSLRRRDARAELWQYRDTQCVLDLFLYPDPAAKTYRLGYFEVHGPDGTPAPGCVAPAIE